MHVSTEQPITIPIAFISHTRPQPRKDPQCAHTASTCSNATVPGGVAAAPYGAGGARGAADWRRAVARYVEAALVVVLAARIEALAVRVAAAFPSRLARLPGPADGACYAGPAVIGVSGAAVAIRQLAVVTEAPVAAVAGVVGTAGAGAV